jgi:hypothetical protein
MEIRSAKEIHETIRSIPVPVSPYTIPEQIDIEKHLMAVEFALPDIIKRLRNISER